MSVSYTNESERVRRLSIRALLERRVLFLGDRGQMRGVLIFFEGEM